MIAAFYLAESVPGLRLGACSFTGILGQYHLHLHFLCHAERLIINNKYSPHYTWGPSSVKADIAHITL